MSVSSPTIFVLSLLVLVTIFKYIIHPTFFSSLSKIPAAHPTAPISALWSLYIRYTNVENVTLLRLHRAKGPIIRLGPNEISINCYDEGLKTVYTGNFDKTDFYPNRFANYGGVTNMLSIRGAKEHAARKRMLSNIYSKSQILTSPIVRSAMTSMIYDRFLPIFQSSAETGEPVDILSLSYAYSIDSFMGYQFGRELGSNFIQDTTTREWYLRNFLGRRPYLFWTIELPALTTFLQKLGVKLIPQWFNQGIEEIEDWNLKICDEAENILSEGVGELAIESQPAVFSAMRREIRKTELKSEKQSTLGVQKELYSNRLEIASEMLDHNAASLETSGVILTYIFYELSLQPALQSELRKELLTLSTPITYSTPSEENVLPDPKALDALPLLDAIVQETLRLYAPAPGPQPRVTPYPSCRLAGVDGIPGGVRVSASAWCLHRNEDVFPESEKWKPERWMDADDKALAEMKRWFWAFGSGGRMCIGSHFAINSLKHAVASVYSNYESKVVDTAGMEQTDGYTTGPQAEKVMITFHSLR